MHHMKRKLTLLLVCLLLLGGTAGASSEEAVASEEISVESIEEAEMPTEEETTATAGPSAKDYINYYLMPGDSPYLEITEAAEYIYTAAGESNYEQIVFSAMDWLALSESAQTEVDATLPDGYLALLQEAVNYASAYANGVVGSAAYVVSFEDVAETGGVSSGISVAEIIEEAGLGGVIYIPDAPALLADFGTDSTVRYSYGWWGGGTIYYGTKTGTLGPIYIGSPFGDAAARDKLRQAKYIRENMPSVHHKNPEPQGSLHLAPNAREKYAPPAEKIGWRCSVIQGFIPRRSRSPSR